MELPRDSWLDRLIRRKGNGLVKIITGVRGCGKSFLLNTLFYRHLLTCGVPEDHILRFAFDSPEDLAAIGEDPLGMRREKRGVNPGKFMAYIRARTGGAGMYYLLLDEVQRMDCFEAVLNGYLRHENMDVFATGSSARFLSTDVSTEFAGRGDGIRLCPLSFAEFLSAFPGDRYEKLSQYLLFGGLPQVILQDSPQGRAAALENLYREAWIPDLVDRHGIRKKDELEDLLNTLASSVGSLTTPEQLRTALRGAGKAGLSSRTIRGYLRCLEDAFLVEPVRRYDIRGRTDPGTPEKYFFSDPGLRSARLRFRPSDPGRAMENVLYNELRMRGYRVDTGVISAAEKGRDGRVTRRQLEVDFVCSRGSALVYVQSAWSLPDEAALARVKEPLLKIRDSFLKIVVTHDPFPAHYDDHGILTVSLCDFLLDPSILGWS